MGRIKRPPSGKDNLGNCKISINKNEGKVRKGCRYSNSLRPNKLHKQRVLIPDIIR